MKKIIMLFSILLAPVLMLPAAGGTEPVRFGFTAIETQGDVSRSTADTVTELVKIELLNHSGIKVIPLGSDRNLALQELELQQSGITSQSTSTDMSGFLGANKILQGKISKLASVYYVSLHVLDLKTGSYDLAKKITICDLGDTQNRIAILVDSIVRGMNGENVNPDSNACKPDLQNKAETAFTRIAKSESARNLPIRRITASSVLREKGFDHNPWVMTDDVLETAWSHGTAGRAGIGEWLLFSFGDKTEITKIAIVNGLGMVEGKWGNLYEANTAIKTAELVYSTGKKEAVTFRKTAEVQEISLKEGAGAEWVRLVITSVYPGKKYTDTCISEIKFFGK